MRRRARQQKRVWLAVVLGLPTLLVGATWALAAATTRLRPGSAMPERFAVGIAENALSVTTASHALEYDDLPAAHRPPAGGEEGVGARGRRYTGSNRVARVFDVREGVEWHGRFATRFTLFVVP